MTVGQSGQHTVQVEGIGQVTFCPLGKVGMKRLQEAARRGRVHGSDVEEWLLRHLPRREAQRLREDALLLSECVVSPHFGAEEFKCRFEGSAEPLGALIQVIRDRSWPNR